MRPPSSSSTLLAVSAAFPPAAKLVRGMLGAGRSAGLTTEYSCACPLHGASGTQEDLQNRLGENSLVIEISCRFCAVQSRIYTAATVAKLRPDTRRVECSTL